MIRLSDTLFRDEEDIAIIDAIDEHLASCGLGERNGESSGAGAMDVTFETHNRQLTAAALDAYLKQHFPTMEYYISDRYEVMFELGLDGDPL